eukprot:303162-Amphidinium_carterae.1
MRKTALLGHAHERVRQFVRDDSTESYCCALTWSRHSHAATKGCCSVKIGREVFSCTDTRTLIAPHPKFIPMSAQNKLETVWI